MHKDLLPCWIQDLVPYRDEVGLPIAYCPSGMEAIVRTHCVCAFLEESRNLTMSGTIGLAS